MLVKGGATVKQAQDLARHSDPKLTMNVYTKLGVHDLADALDKLPATSTGAQRPILRATGTDDTAAEHQKHCQPKCQQRAHESVRSRTTRHDESDGGALTADERKPLQITKKRDATRPHATQDAKATSGIRTPDLCFTKALLYR